MKKNKILLIVFVSLILIFQFTLQLYLSRADSQTTDEGVHLSAGYTYLTKNDFRFNPEHPPLVKIFSALPLLFANLNSPHDESYFNKAQDFFYDSWREARGYGEDFLYALSNDADRLLLLARLPMILLTLLLGLTIFYISTKIWGTGGGLLSLGLFVLEPLVFAHGHLVTTDIAVSLGYLLSIYLLWKFAKQSTWRNIILLGLAIGFAQLTKYTAIIIYPASIILLIYNSVAGKESFKQFFKKFGRLVIAFLISWVVICGGYFFKTQTIPHGSEERLPFLSVIIENKNFEPIGNILIPRDYFKGLSIVLGHTEFGHDSFLLGKHSNVGWWYYFPVVFSAKTTIPTLIIFALSLLIILRNRENRKKGLFLLIGGLIFLAFAMNSKANLGVRHIMPVYIILFVLSGALVNSLKKFKFGKLMVFVLLAWLVLENAMVFPHYISYYNQFYGGTKSGYKVATDSNYDWGQDLKRIRNYLANANLDAVAVQYSWDSDKALSYYGIPLTKYDPSNKNLKYLVVNATALNNPPFEPLQNMPIYDRITPSVFVYELNEENAKQD